TRLSEREAYVSRRMGSVTWFTLDQLFSRGVSSQERGVSRNASHDAFGAQRGEVAGAHAKPFAEYFGFVIAEQRRRFDHRRPIRNRRKRDDVRMGWARREPGGQRSGTESLQTHRWRGQSRANPSLKVGCG